MKKGLLFLLLLTQIAFGQVNTGTTKSGKYQMNIPDLGVKKDSVVVWNGTSKLLKYLPISEIKSITNLGYVATPTGGTVFSSSGNSTDIPLATTANAGLFSASEKVKLEGITTTPDATATVKGKIKLAGDLGGTADSPTTPTALHKTGDEEKIGSLKATSLGAPALYGMHNGVGVGVLGYSISGDGLRAISATGIGLRVQNANGNTSNLAEFGILSTASKIDYLGNITGKSFVKTGGNNSQILMADGNTVQIETLELVTNKQNSLSFDASNEKYPTVTAVRAADANNVKTSGNQSISGQKYFSNGLGKQITLLNTNNSAVLQVDNDSATTGTAVLINPKSNSIGARVSTSTGVTGVKYISFTNNSTEVFNVEQDGKVNANSFVKTGSDNTQILMGDGSTNTVLSGSAVLDFPSTSGGLSDLTIPITGANIGDVVTMGVPDTVVIGLSVYLAWVSAPNTVKVRLIVAGGTVDPPAAVFKIKVFK